MPDTNPLARYRSKNRVLLIFAPSPHDTRWKRQAAVFAESDATRNGLSDRELLRFDLFAQRPHENLAGVHQFSPGDAAQVRRQLGVRPGDFRVILVGKDGNAAYSTSRPVVPRDLFARIDRMPMRRDEMRRRGEKP